MPFDSTNAQDELVAKAKAKLVEVVRNCTTFNQVHIALEAVRADYHGLSFWTPGMFVFDHVPHDAVVICDKFQKQLGYVSTGIKPEEWK